MDTILYCQEKRIIQIVGLAINCFIIACCVAMPIFANDLIAKISAPAIDTSQVNAKIMNEISPEVRAKNFDEKIKNKYPKGVIINVDNGIKHIKLTKYYDGKPVKINVVEIDQKLAKGYELMPALASNTLNNRRTITTIAKNSNSIIALNGTFFKQQTGVPLGTLMINKKIYTGPIYDRVAFGIFEDGYDVARVKLNAKLIAKDNEIKIDNINQPRMLATYMLAYTKEWGSFAPPTPKYGIQIAVENNKITQISTKSLQIPKNDGFVLVGPAILLKDLRIDDRVKLDITTNPQWQNVKHIISGGPYLIKDGEVFIDITAEKLNSIGGKNPRSAIGYTGDNHLILVAVDGREGSSVGMTLNQLAGFMKSLGCVGAINLDGGGSTVMYVNGKVVNNPQQTGGIAISNAIVLSKKI